jgi:hypothetical protein
LRLIHNEVGALVRDLEAKLVTSGTLDSIRTRFFEVVEVSDSLDEEARERLLRRWEAELTDYTSAFIGRSLTGSGDLVLIGSLSGTA